MPLAGTYSPEGFFFDGRWLLFAAGIGVYYAAIYANRLGVIAIVAFIVGAMAQAYYWPSHTVFYINYQVGYLFALVILALRPLDEGMSKWRILAPFSFCGLMCQSIYLVHWPLVKIISKALAYYGLTTDAETALIVVPVYLAASILTGYLFYLAVERHFLNSPPAQRAPSTSRLC